tara:strand:+ start:601 stop:879 length:279 start_codon:yes stop_codon:yes gene_type:complete
MSSIEDKVCEKIQKRAEVGKSKYGVTMERTDLSTIEWLTHLQEELMDAAVYVERLLGDLSAALKGYGKEKPVEEPDGFVEICMDCGLLTCTC